MDERQRQRQRLDEAESNDDEVIGANSSAAAMTMMILSTDLVGRHRRNASTSPSVDEFEGDNDANQAGSRSESMRSSSSCCSSSSAESCDTDTSNKENENGNNEDGNVDGLSEYERLRQRNIERNQKRLASLGLLRHQEEHSKKNAGAEGAVSASSRKRKGSSLAQPPPPSQPRRSLPRRHCSKYRHCDSSDNDDDDDSSVMPSPIPITRTLRPQSHQRTLNEHHLKEYMRTRRVGRGRPRREEYEYKCEENCASCGGGWIFDNQKRNIRNDDDVSDDDGNSCHGEDVSHDQNDEDTIEERTRLIRCKDCRGAFHLECMLIHGKENCESGVETIGENVSDEIIMKTMTEPSRMTTRDPKRCYRCEVKRKEERQLLQKTQNRPLNSASACPLTLLEATIENRVVGVRVSIEPLLLEANVHGRDISCIVTLHGRASSKRGRLQESAKDVDHVKRRDDYEDVKSTDVHEIQQLINKALSNTGNARLQATFCISLQKYVTTEVSTSIVGRLGGIRVLWNALRNHVDGPNVQAEAIRMLTEIHRVCPQLVEVEMTRRGGCVDLAILSMERHPFHTKVQLMTCRMFRTLAHDAKCCAKVKSKKVVLAVANSIRRNPRKQDLIAEGSTFLQNIMTPLAETTVNMLLRMNNQNNDDFPGLIPTLITSMRTNKSDLSHVMTLFGVLSTITLTSKGSTLLRSLNIDSLVIEMVQEHFDTPYLHEVVFSFLRKVIIVHGSETTAAQRSSDLINIGLKSAMKYPRNEVIQENICRLLVALTSHSDGEAQRLVQGKWSRRILTLAGENFPDSCQEFVRTLLPNN